MRADVVIVGGGPAGSVTALLLARAGFSVVLLERRQFPRTKACGDCLSPGANPILERLGVWNDVIATRPAFLDGWLLTAPDAAFSASFDGNARSIAISRDRLDSVLLDAAVHAGAVVHYDALVTDVLRTATGDVTGVEARIGDEPAVIHTRLTIGADGLRSRVARRLGAYARAPQLRKVSLTAHLRGVPGVKSRGEMHVRGDACLGIAPVDASGDLCNVTVVLHQRSVNPGERRALMSAALRRFPERDLSHLVMSETEVLTSGPFDWPTKQIAFSGAALVGDAAGYYDPFTGQGIFQALAGAEMLGEHAAAYLHTRRLRELNSYAARQRAMVRSARRIQRGIEYVCSRPALAAALFGRLSRAQPAADRLVAVIGDQRPARDLLSPYLLTRLLL